MSAASPDRAAWDSAVRKWEAARVIRNAAETYGPGYRLDGDHKLARFRLEAEYGKQDAARKGTPAYEAFEREDQRYEEAIEAYWGYFHDPAREAAEEIVMTPAPDFDALRYKSALIEADARRLVV